MCMRGKRAIRKVIFGATRLEGCQGHFEITAPISKALTIAVEDETGNCFRGELSLAESCHGVDNALREFRSLRRIATVRRLIHELCRDSSALSAPERAMIAAKAAEFGLPPPVFREPELAVGKVGYCFMSRWGGAV